MKILILKLLDLYKKWLSPARWGVHTCRFTPSCADYTKEAIEKYGVIKGGYLGTIRTLKCNPWGPSGYDPVK